MFFLKIFCYSDLIMSGQGNLYLVCEGLGGAGKGSVIKYLEKKFRDLGFRVILTFEPGGTERANALRAELFERKKQGTITPREELEYVFAARSLNMEEVVIPALASEEPTVVLKDRDYLSSFMYQVASGADRSLLLEFFRKNYDHRGFPRPSLRLLLTLNSEEAWRRRHAAGLGGDGFDMQPDEYWRMVSLNYWNEAMEISAGRGLFFRETAMVDAEQLLERVCQDAWRMVVRRLVPVDPEIAGWRLAESQLGGRWMRGWVK